MESVCMGNCTAGSNPALSARVVRYVVSVACPRFISGSPRFQPETPVFSASRCRFSTETWIDYIAPTDLARIMHKSSTAPTKSSGVLHRLRYTRSASSTYRTVRLREPTRKRVPPRVAQRTQVGAFVALRDENLCIIRASAWGWSFFFILQQGGECVRKGKLSLFS